MNIKLTLFIALLAFTHINCAADTIIENSKAPAAITQFISTYYTNLQLVLLKKDTDLTKTEYEATLNNGTELTFNNLFKIQKIEGKVAIPDTLIGKSILQYVKSNYAGNKILEWEQKNKQQKIELDNGIELYFDLAGNFVRIDN